MIVGIGIISSLITMGTTAIVVDGYIQSVLKQFNVPLKHEPVTASSIWRSLWQGSSSGAEMEVEKGPAANSSSSLGSGGNDDKGQVNSGSGNTNEFTDKPTDKQQDPLEDEALPVWGSVSEEAGSANKREEVVIPPESWTDSKSQLPAEMKDEIFRTLLQKLPQEDWQRISTLMEGGLTSNELSEVEQILAKHLNDEEYDKMRSMLAGATSDNSSGNNGVVPKAGAEGDRKTDGVDGTVDPESVTPEGSGQQTNAPALGQTDADSIRNGTEYSKNEGQAL